MYMLLCMKEKKHNVLLNLVSAMSDHESQNGLFISVSVSINALAGHVVMVANKQYCVVQQ